MEQSLNTACERTRDQLLAARCESREPDTATKSHLDHCVACQTAHTQLTSASPEALALLVLMRGLTPSAKPKKKLDIKPDEEFEAYLAAEVAKLPPGNRRATVERLARLDFYGLALPLLYPEYDTMPADLDPPDDGYVHPLYEEIDETAADEIASSFIDANFDRFKHYRQLDL